MLKLTFESTIFEWRGPSPYFFAAIPERHTDAIRHAAKLASYGWGVVPVEATIADVTFTTSLFPKNEGYLLPIKDRVRRAARVTAGDSITVSMTVKAR
jgi:hypothetical protein